MASISFRARSSDVFGLGVGFDAGAYDEGIECRHIRLGWRSGSPTVGPTERAKMATEEELRHVVFRCDPWLASFPLTEATAIEYFSLSPFYEKDCLNETLRARGIRPDEVEAMKSMVGTEYVVLASRPPHLFAIAKRRRMNPERTKLIAMYYLLDGNVYQAPTLLELITSRTVSRMDRCLVRCAINEKEANSMGRSLLPGSVRTRHQTRLAFSSSISKEGC